MFPARQTGKSFVQIEGWTVPRKTKVEVQFARTVVPVGPIQGWRRDRTEIIERFAPVSQKCDASHVNSNLSHVTCIISHIQLHKAQRTDKMEPTQRNEILFGKGPEEFHVKRCNCFLDYGMMSFHVISCWHTCWYWHAQFSSLFAFNLSTITTWAHDFTIFIAQLAPTHWDITEQMFLNNVRHGNRRTFL